MTLLASLPGLPAFCSSAVCFQYNDKLLLLCDNYTDCKLNQKMREA